MAGKQGLESPKMPLLGILSTDTQLTDSLMIETHNFVNESMSDVVSHLGLKESLRDALLFVDKAYVAEQRALLVGSEDNARSIPEELMQRRTKRGQHHLEQGGGAGHHIALEVRSYKLDLDDGVGNDATKTVRLQLKVKSIDE